MILFVFVIAWAIMGAAEETWGDARTGIRGVRTRARASAARRFRAARTHPSRSVRWPAHAAYGTAKTTAGVWHATRATGRGVRRAGSSFRTGFKAGAVRGREKHAAYVEKRRVAAARPYATFDSAGSTSGEPARSSTATVKPIVRTTTDTEETAAAEPDEAPDPDDHTAIPDPDDAAPAAHTQEEPPMSMPTGEASSYEATQAAFKEIAAKAVEFVSAVDNLQGGLQTANLDSETLGECAEIIDAAQNVQTTAEKALNGLESRHSQLHEAIASASVEPADTAWYRG